MKCTRNEFKGSDIDKRYTDNRIVDGTDTAWMAGIELN